MTAAATMTAGMYFYAYFCLNVDVFLLYLLLLLLFYALGRPTNVCGRWRWMVGWCLHGGMSVWLAVLSGFFVFSFCNILLKHFFFKNKRKKQNNNFKKSIHSLHLPGGDSKRGGCCVFFGNLDANQQARVISHHIYTWNTFWKKQIEKNDTMEAHMYTHTLLNTAQKLSQKKTQVEERVHSTSLFNKKLFRVCGDILFFEYFFVSSVFYERFILFNFLLLVLLLPVRVICKIYFISFSHTG